LSLHLLTIATSTQKVLNNNIKKKNIKVVTRNSPLMSLINQMRRNSFAFWLNKARTGGHWEPFLTAFSCKSAKLHVLYVDKFNRPHWQKITIHHDISLSWHSSVVTGVDYCDSY
jgi:hypothetical protein